MATETLSASRTIKAYTQEATQSAHFATQSDASFHAERTRLRTRAVLVGMAVFLGTTAIVILIWSGARLVFAGTVSAGELVQFLIFALLASGALVNMSEILGTLQLVAGATERLFEILNTKTRLHLRSNPIPLPDIPIGRLEFKQVSFAYHARESEVVLKNVSLCAEPGETIAIVGLSGSGKSTLFALAQRFYDLDSGAVLVDGVDVRDTDIRTLRRRFAYVEQHSFIFSGT
ncbi:uncharacterized protein LOC102803257, partial [Saccoglossus kowalevskii]|uniref:ATP-dependent permease MDL1, mitochondrial-like n=1 Tax=Saccoglossus kowalevskii TaxID=10224 RepID=A0ABM0M7Y3_SACKO